MKKAPWLTMKVGLKPAGTTREKKPRRIRPVSKARAKQMAQYRKVRDEFLKANPRCFCCSAPATDVHHQKGRAASLLLDERYYIALCRPCHSWVDSNRGLAYLCGLLKHGWNNPK